MKTGFYIASLFAALILLTVLLIVINPGVDRERNVFFIGLSMFVLAIHLGILAIYPFTRSNSLAKMVIGIGFASMFSMLLLAFSCQPNLEVKSIFTTINSQLTY
jgi:hypothetical protein